MKRLEKTAKNVNMIKQKSLKTLLSFFLGIGLVCLWTGSTTTSYGQGTIGETVGTMEIGQEIDNGVNQSAPKGGVDTKKPAQDTNNVTQQPNRAPANTQGRPNPAPQTPQTTTESQRPGQTPAEVETKTTEPTGAAEANVPDINDFNSFKREINRIDIEARGEDALWLDKQEKKADLAKAMNDVAVAELRFLQKVAAEINDTNTVEAIKLVLKLRQDRLNKLVTKIENENKDERRQQMGDRPQRQPRQPRATGGQNQGERPARSTNPAGRTRETVNQEQP
jgi:hypothetical protein